MRDTGAPDAAHLGDLAVGSATGDYMYVTGPDMPGALYLRGLDPAARYTLRLFAPRADAAHYSPLPQLAHTFTVRPMSSRISRQRS